MRGWLRKWVNPRSVTLAPSDPILTAGGLWEAFVLASLPCTLPGAACGTKADI